MAVLLRRRRLGRTSCKALSELSQEGIRVVRCDKKMPEDDLYIRWGTTTNVPTKNVINTAKAIHEVSDKAGFRRVLDEHELCPPTVFSEDIKFGMYDLADNPIGEEPEPYEMPCDFPMILRPATHAGGKNLRLVQDVDEMLRYGIFEYNGDWYASKYIPKVAEYRVYVVQGRAVAVAEKIPEDKTAIAWNHSEGSTFKNVRWDDWPLKAVRTSIEAFNLSSLDFGGVDVIVAEDGSCYVLEINSAPSLTTPYRQGCMAKALDYIIRNGKKRIPLIKERGGYLKFIHPAICERAKV